eukprot:6089112-Amphidinium_carterae.1
MHAQIYQRTSQPNRRSERASEHVTREKGLENTCISSESAGRPMGKGQRSVRRIGRQHEPLP